MTGFIFRSTIQYAFQVSGDPVLLFSGSAGPGVSVSPGAFYLSLISNSGRLKNELQKRGAGGKSGGKKRGKGSTVYSWGLSRVKDLDAGVPLKPRCSPVEPK